MPNQLKQVFATSGADSYPPTVAAVLYDYAREREAKGAANDDAVLALLRDNEYQSASDYAASGTPLQEGWISREFSAVRAIARAMDDLQKGVVSEASKDALSYFSEERRPSKQAASTPIYQSSPVPMVG